MMLVMEGVMMLPDCEKATSASHPLEPSHPETRRVFASMSVAPPLYEEGKRNNPVELMLPTRHAHSALADLVL
jgi:hypothetical protein